MEQKFVVDKTIFLHIGVSCALTFFISLFMILINTPVYASIISGTIATLLCGITKEYCDSIHYYWNWADMLGNIIGILIGIIILILMF